MSLKPLCIVGWYEGSAGLVDSWADSIGYKVVAFISIDNEPIDGNPERFNKLNSKFSYPKDGSFKNRPLVIDPQWYDHLSTFPAENFLITLDNQIMRDFHLNKAKKASVPLINALHPTALVLGEAEIGVNVIMHAKSFVGYKVIVHDGVVINTGAQVDHHTIVESCVTIDPNVTLAGNVILRKRSRVCTGAIITPKVTIEEDAIVGAGALVRHNVIKGSTVIGVPARQII